jgi:biopolymer transport protein TolQ
MEPQTVIELAAPTGDFSFWHLFWKADYIVKGVIVCMVLASVGSWAIALEKTITYFRARREADVFERMFWSGQSLDDLYASLSQKKASSMISLFVAAMREWRRSSEGNPKPLPGVLMRIERVMEVTIAREMDRLERRLLFLATVGSTAPFVGLFGTVWGIMNSFESIAVSKNTNLAVVAPGIAEALFATALGLFAAIPAVVFYNIFSARTAHYGQRLESFSDEFLAIVSRQIDLRG